MQVRMKKRFVVASLAFLAAAVQACQDPNAFQPITYGAKPWQPPACWAPTWQCATGYYVAVDSCPGCTGVSYALCSGDAFDQCVCGGPFTPGATCPAQIHCAVNDFPPQNWIDFGSVGANPGCGWYVVDVLNATDAGVLNAPDGGG